MTGDPLELLKTGNIDYQPHIVHCLSFFPYKIVSVACVSVRPRKVLGSVGEERYQSLKGNESTLARSEIAAEEFRGSVTTRAHSKLPEEVETERKGKQYH